MNLVLKRCCGENPVGQVVGDGVLSVKCQTCGREFRFPAYREQGNYFPANKQELEKQVEEWNKGVITIGR